MPRQWEPRDYVLARTHCPHPSIQETLREYRHLCGAELLVLLTYDERAVLRTLTFVSGLDDPEETRLRHLALAPSMAGSAPGRHPFNDLSILPLEDILVRALARSGKFMGHHPTFYEALVKMLEHDHLQVDKIDMASPALSVAIVRKGGSALTPQQLLSLATQINGTSNAALYRDAVVTSTVDQALQTISAGSDMNASMLGLLKMAADVTHSDAGALYLLDTSTSPAALAQSFVHSKSTKIATVSDHYPTRLEAEQDWPIVSATFVRNRTLLSGLADGDAEDNLAPAWHSDCPEVGVEIALPIPSAPGGFSTSTIGVLSLMRSTGGHIYADYDIALLRNVVLRMALLRAAQQTAAFGSSFKTALRRTLLETELTSQPPPPGPQIEMLRADPPIPHRPPTGCASGLQQPSRNSASDRLTFRNYTLSDSEKCGQAPRLLPASGCCLAARKNQR